MLIHPKLAKLSLIALCVALFAGNVVEVMAWLSLYRRHQDLKLNPTSLGRFDESVPEKKEGQMRIVLLGDSRMDYWRPTPSLGGHQVINRGVGGDTTAQVRLRVEEQVLALEPDLVILQVGINDLQTIGAFPDRERYVRETALRNIEETVQRIHASGARIWITSVFPVGPIPLSRRPVWSDKTLDAVLWLNKQLSSIDGEMIRFIDLDSTLSKDGRMKPEYALDEFHLTKAGYAALEARLNEALDAL